MGKIKEIILNKKYLILFYFEAIFLQVFVLRIFTTGNLYNLLENLIWGINSLWVFIIFLDDIFHKRFNLKDRKLLYLILFFVISTISWLFCQSHHGFYYIYDLVKLYEFSFIFYTFSSNHTNKEIKNVIRIIAYTFCTYVLIYVLISLVHYITGNTMIHYPNGTSYNAIGIDNEVAHKERYMGVWSWYTIASFHCYIALVLHLYLIDQGKNKIIHSIGIIANAYMIYLTDSRSSLIILAFVLLSGILFLLKKNIGAKKAIYTCILLICISIVGFIVYKAISNPTLFQQFLSNPYQTLVVLSSGRLQMAKGIIDNLKNHLLLGEGYGNNDLVQSHYGIVHPHNVIMACLLYTGIIGLLLFILFIIKNIQSIIKNMTSIFNSQYKWILVLTICLFIESMFDICIIGARSTNIETPFFWLCLGIISYNTFKEDELI